MGKKAALNPKPALKDKVEEQTWLPQRYKGLLGPPLRISTELRGCASLGSSRAAKGLLLGPPQIEYSWESMAKCYCPTRDQ